MQSRSSSRTRAKNLSNSPSPSSRLGRLFPPIGRDSVTPARQQSNLHFRPIELGSFDPHAMRNNRELTCDRNLGLAEPVALGEPHPPSLPTGAGWATGCGRGRSAATAVPTKANVAALMITNFSSCRWRSRPQHQERASPGAREHARQAQAS